MTKCLKINIAFILDDGYALPTGVAISSLRENRNTDFIYDIYLLCSKISNDNKSRLHDLKAEKFNIIILDLEKEKLFRGIKNSCLGFSATPTSLYKFLIADILKEVDKVLYLDGDIIIQSDLKSLFEVDIKSYYAAVVKEGPRKKAIKSGKAYNHFATETYFNSGVMLLNLKLLRNENVSEKLIDYRLNGYNIFMDQDALNYVFYKKVKYLPYQYNLLLQVLSPIWEMNSIEEISNYYEIPKVKNKDQYFKEAKIIHYTTGKPWKFYNIPQAEKWWSYYQKSVFSDINISREAYTYILPKIFYNVVRIGNLLNYVPLKIKAFIKNILQK